MGLLPQGLLFEGTRVGKHCAMCTAEFCISAFLVVGLAFAGIRDVELIVDSANLSGKARRAAALEAQRVRM